jgi:hypothetical protein
MITSLFQKDTITDVLIALLHLHLEDEHICEVCEFPREGIDL